MENRFTLKLIGERGVLFLFSEMGIHAYFILQVAFHLQSLSLLSLETRSRQQIREPKTMLI